MTNLLPDRNPLYVALSDGGIRNGYTLKILNKLHEPHTFEIKLDGLPDARLTLTGYERAATPALTVATDVLGEVRLFVGVPAASLKALTPQAHTFSVIVRDTQTGQTIAHKTVFRRPL